MSRPHVLIACLLSILTPAALAACGGGTQDRTQPIVVEAPAEDPETRPGGAETPPGDEPGTAAAGDQGLVVSEDACETDGDCVPAECCHAAACVARDHAPACADAMCTQDCRYGTLDCGGACLCHEGRCAARLSEPPAGFPAVQ